MKELTPRQAEVLAFIVTFVGERGFPPTFREIGRAFGFKSTNAAGDVLKALKKKGCITLQSGASRGIRLTADVPELQNGDLIQFVRGLAGTDNLVIVIAVSSKGSAELRASVDNPAMIAAALRESILMIANKSQGVER